jgi:pimeloyl-ACP methyl ester carboxylesterase
MMNRISVNGTKLEYELRGTGTGEPVVLIHWGVGAKWAEPLLEQQALSSRYQLLSYHRAGFAGSGRLEGPPAMAAHAAHCHQLMRELGITRAHIVSHSSSVPVALQLALDAPDAVHTLTLMEAARPAAPTDAERQFGTDVVVAALQHYRAGDKAEAVDIFFRGVFGPGYRAALDHGLPGAFDQAVADADAFFTQEMPAIQQWPFTEHDAHCIRQPALAVLGTASPVMFAERRKLLLRWLPNAEPLDLPGLTHLLHVQDPAAVADRLTRFFARHPVNRATLTGRLPAESDRTSAG